MREFIDIITSFPVVVFSVSTFMLLGFWVMTTLMGAGINALDDFDFDFDAETDVDIEGDLELDGDGTGVLRAALDFLGITGMPLLLALNLLSLFAWFISFCATEPSSSTSTKRPAFSKSLRTRVWLRSHLMFTAVRSAARVVIRQRLLRPITS